MWNLGDTAYRAGFENIYHDIPCPDCTGSTRLTVILGDGSQVRIPCAGCASGGNPPTGKVSQCTSRLMIQKGIVTRMELRDGELEYGLDIGGRSYATEENIFATEKAASEYGEKLREDRETEENRKLLAKTKNARSWAWHVTYYRRRIGDLEKELEHHREKLGIATVKVKETGK